MLLGTFMGGMCLGSLLLPRLVSQRWHPLRVYALLELGIGALGLAVLFGMPSIEQVYVRYAGHGLPGTSSCEGPWPGSAAAADADADGAATLPAIARWVQAGPEGVSWLGFFYGGNIVGAVFGCLLAGFYLLRVFDMGSATCVAFALNLTVAAIALALAIPARYEPPVDPATKGGAGRAAGAWAVYPAIALSGMSALGAEVVWTRLLSLMLGATVYTFSLVLAVFLLGLGIGSSLGAFLAKRTASAQVALGVCQWLLTAAIAWTSYMISESLPYWPIVPSLSTSPWSTIQLDLFRCGLSGPSCAAGMPVGGELPDGAGGGRLPRPGPRPAGRRGLRGQHRRRDRRRPGVQPAAGPHDRHGRRRAGPDRAGRDGRAGGPDPPAPAGPRSGCDPGIGGNSTSRDQGWPAWLTLERDADALGGRGVWLRQVLPMVLARSAPGTVKEVPKGPGGPELYCIYVGEGMNVSVAVTETNLGVRSFHGAGKIQASTLPTDMRLQRMLGHIPALLHKNPESVLVVACGAGVTAGTFVLHPEVKRIVICDIEPLVPTTVAPMFGKENYHVVDGIALENPHTVGGKEVEVVYDDGRHFLRTTEEKFDIITSDPIDPWVKGCASLNTVEYYQMCRDHLNPGKWIVEPSDPAQRERPRDADQEPDRHLLSGSFPDGILWSNGAAASSATTVSCSARSSRR